MDYAALDPMYRQLLQIIFLALLFIGLLLAFAGRWVFETILSFLGSIVGAVVGFDLGMQYFGPTCWGGLLLGIIGALVGGLIFHYIVEFAIALFCGLLAAVVVLVFLPGAVLPAIIVCIAVAAICWYFIKEIVGIVTALMGGMLTGYALLGLHALLGWSFPSGLLILLAILVFVAGAAVQVSSARKGKAKEKPAKKEPDEDKTKKEEEPKDDK